MQLRRRLLAATQPTAPAVLAGALADLARSTGEVIAAIVLRRSVQRPRCTPADRALLTLLRRHRQLFRGYRRWTSRAAVVARKPTVSAETLALIWQLAAANPLRGAERIRGARRKRDSRAATWTAQQYLRSARPPQRVGQDWATFARNHAERLEVAARVVGRQWPVNRRLAVIAMIRPCGTFGGCCWVVR